MHSNSNNHAFSPQPAMLEKDVHFCLSVLDSLSAIPESSSLLLATGFGHHFAYAKTLVPPSLSAIKEKLRSRGYQAVGEFDRDVRFLLNSIFALGDENELFHAVSRLSECYEPKMKKYFSFEDLIEMNGDYPASSFSGIDEPRQAIPFSPCLPSPKSCNLPLPSPKSYNLPLPSPKAQIIPPRPLPSPKRRLCRQPPSHLQSSKGHSHHDTPLKKRPRTASRRPHQLQPLPKRQPPILCPHRPLPTDPTTGRPIILSRQVLKAMKSNFDKLRPHQARALFGVLTNLKPEQISQQQVSANVYSLDISNLEPAVQWNIKWLLEYFLDVSFTVKPDPTPVEPSPPQVQPAPTPSYTRLTPQTMTGSQSLPLGYARGSPEHLQLSPQPQMYHTPPAEPLQTYSNLPRGAKFTRLTSPRHKRFTYPQKQPKGSLNNSSKSDYSSSSESDSDAEMESSSSESESDEEYNSNYGMWTVENAQSTY